MQYEGYLLRAKIVWALGRKREALHDLRQAMQAAESQRAHISGAERERAKAFSQFREAYERMVDWQTELGDVEEALQIYETVVKQASGEEARCRYAMLLERSGQPDKAREVYYEIVTRAQRSPRYYRRQQKQWIDIARQNLGYGGK